jgi:hypothetical protein
MPKTDQKPSNTTAKSRKQRTAEDLAFPINITDIDLSKVWGGQYGPPPAPYFPPNGPPAPYFPPPTSGGTITVMCCW